jgi:predicted aldo/keto reductase-like oxidoreductase
MYEVITIVQPLATGYPENGMEKAAKCTHCRECEKCCPYHLTIREMIAELVEWYQGRLNERQK